MPDRAPRLPPLAAVRCFEAAARHLSFTRAAEELGMTQAAVSYQVKLLEERFGPLFLRKPRGVELTEAGRRLAPAVTASFDALRAAFEEYTQSAEGVLAITVLETFAANWLVPRLGAFQIAHPDIAVRLDVSQWVVDFAREEFDIGIRHNSTGSWPGLIAHPLIELEYTPMLSPELLARKGPIEKPEDLLRLPVIESLDPWWPAWFEAAGIPGIDFNRFPNIQLGPQHLAGKAAMAAQGVALLTPAFYREELASGRLIQPFPLLGRAGYCCLVYPESRRHSPKIKAFRDWILEALKEETRATQALAADLPAQTG